MLRGIFKKGDLFKKRKKDYLKESYESLSKYIKNARVKGITKEEVVFIGDSPQDYEAALACGVPFIGRDGGKSFGDADIQIVKDFNEISKLISENLNVEV